MEGAAKEKAAPVAGARRPPGRFDLVTVEEGSGHRGPLARLEHTGSS